MKIPHSFSLYDYVNSHDVNNKLKMLEGWKRNISKLNQKDEAVKMIKEYWKNTNAKSNPRSWSLHRRPQKLSQQYIFWDRDMSRQP